MLSLKTSYSRRANINIISAYYRVRRNDIDIHNNEEDEEF